MNGVLVVDKPQGRTSHDVVAVARRALGERAIGHTGTLDPMATGVLPLACGKATRLVRFLSASDKAYDAVVRFGEATDSYDVTGRVIDTSARRPDDAVLRQALAAMLGTHLQQPPAFSAKRVGGQRAYDLARAQVPVSIAPAPVTLHDCQVVSWTGDDLHLRLTCSAGFYVRTLAHEIGQRTGSCAALASLRRTRAGAFSLDHVVDFETLVAAKAAPDAAARVGERLIPLGALLTQFPAVEVPDTSVVRVSRGQELATTHYRALPPAGAAWPPNGPPASGFEASPWTRVLTADQQLIAVATPGGSPGALHPSVVLI